MSVTRSRIESLVFGLGLVVGTSFGDPLWAAPGFPAAADPNTNAEGKDESDAQARSHLDQKIDSVLPKPEEERWLRINWQSNIMKARLESQHAGKPMLIWVMDGNVLGCT